MGLLKSAMNDALGMMGEARLNSMALKDEDVCVNCKNVRKARDSRNKECISCGLTGEIVRFTSRCPKFQKPFLGQAGDKRRSLILRDMMYRKYY